MWHHILVPFSSTVFKLACSSSFIGHYKVGRYGGRGLNVLLQRWATAATSESPSCFRPGCWGGSGGRGGGRTTAGEDFPKTWTQKTHAHDCFCMLTAVLLCITIFSLLLSLPVSLLVLEASRHHELHVGCRWHGLHGISKPKQQSLSFSVEECSSTVQALQKVDALIQSLTPKNLRSCNRAIGQNGGTTVYTEAKQQTTSSRSSWSGEQSNDWR